MTYTEIIGQGFGILGMMSYILSFQAKKNTNYFTLQIMGGFLFALNFMLIGAVPGFIMNVANVIRGFVLIKSDRKIPKLIFCELLCIASVVSALIISPERGIFLAITLITLIAQISGTFFMWNANGKYIRYNQFLFLSPAWLVYDIANFTLGGILCESFNMISVVVSFIRYGKDGFEK